jgi:hypothetical protein
MFGLTACNLFMNCCNVIRRGQYGKLFRLPIVDCVFHLSLILSVKLSNILLGVMNTSSMCRVGTDAGRKFSSGLNNARNIISDYRSAVLLDGFQSVFLAGNKGAWVGV